MRIRTRDLCFGGLEPEECVELCLVGLFEPPEPFACGRVVKVATEPRGEPCTRERQQLGECLASEEAALIAVVVRGGIPVGIDAAGTAAITLGGGKGGEKGGKISVLNSRLLNCIGMIVRIPPPPLIARAHLNTAHTVRQRLAEMHQWVRPLNRRHPSRENQTKSHIGSCSN